MFQKVSGLLLRGGGRAPISFCTQLTSSVRVRVRLFSSMPPIETEALREVNHLIEKNRVVIFSKSFCPFCTKVKDLFHGLNVDYFALELDSMGEKGVSLQNALLQKTGMKTVPNVFVRGKHLGGCDSTFAFHAEDKLVPLLQWEENPSDGPITNNGDVDYQYDLVVIGGGSGGLAASKQAAKLGKRVAVCDFVKPTPLGTSWGLGGTCVNVGCIPKKLMHQGALIGQAISDGPSFGWETLDTKTHKWETLVEGIQNYIGSLNWGYRVSLKESNVTYLNNFAEFQDEHTITATNKKGQVEKITSKHFLVAVGGRPKYPDIPGAREHAITSDDLFSLPHNPGKTLCIGASYIALECAGFLAGLGIDTTVMVRSILLRGFDQQVSEMLGEHMKGHGIKFLREWVPTSIEKLEDGSPARLLVRAKETNGEATHEEEFNTVILAIGRDPCTPDLKLGNAGVKMSPKTGKILTNPGDQTNVRNIFAIGDVAEGRPELTPVAIQAGRLLAKRLYGGSTVLTDYENVPTTVFTPMEYGCVGLSEEDALAKYGADNVEVYHSNFQALEHTLPNRDSNAGYCKLVCVKPQNEKVVGFHYVGPNAGEVTQGFGMAVRLGATKEDFDSLIGIHPTCAETFTSLDVTKSSGLSSMKKGC